MQMKLEVSEEMWVAPGEARWFLFPLSRALADLYPPFSLAYPSRPQEGKQSLWTIAHGVHTEGEVSQGPQEGAVPTHLLVLHYVTVQVADPQIATPFKVHTLVWSEE